MSAAAKLPLTTADAVEPSVRYDRPALIGFIADTRTEEALRDGLNEAHDIALDLRRGGIKAAIATMQKHVTPRVLIVDVSGEEQPLTALGELAHVVEPGVIVLLVGDNANMDFYREVTRGLGAAEYLTKPLTRDVVARHFLPHMEGKGAGTGASTPGRRAISITGTRGGSGATTIAVNLAWQLGVVMRRHTVLLDPDVQLGTAALLLNVQQGAGLRMALETPERIDALLAERAALPAADRLHVLASEEKLDTPFKPAPRAAAALTSALRKRYNFVVADVPADPEPLYRDLLEVVDQRVIVMLPTLPAVRDALRLLALPSGEGQMERPIIILNRNGLPGGLTKREVETALKTKVDIIIPDLPRHIGSAATMGEPAINSSSSLRGAIVELARLVAFTGLLDSSGDLPDGLKTAKRRGLRALLGGK
jgi:pilus assembly protein CpaE